MSLWSRISNVFREDALNREIEEEFEAHIAEAIEQGRDPQAARLFGRRHPRSMQIHRRRSALQRRHLRRAASAAIPHITRRRR